MKIHRNKMILIVFALQLLMLLAVIAMVCAVSGRGRTVTLEMAGYDPYDACGAATSGSAVRTAGSRWNLVPLNATKTDAKAPYLYMWSWIRTRTAVYRTFPMHPWIVRTAIPPISDVPPNICGYTKMGHRLASSQGLSSIT